MSSFVFSKRHVTESEMEKETDVFSRPKNTVRVITAKRSAVDHKHLYLPVDKSLAFSKPLGRYTSKERPLFHSPSKKNAILMLLMVNVIKKQLNERKKKRKKKID